MFLLYLYLAFIYGVWTCAIATAVWTDKMPRMSMVFASFLIGWFALPVVLAVALISTIRENWS